MNENTEQRVSASRRLFGQGSAAAGVSMRHRFLPTRAGVIELLILFALMIVIERLVMAPGEFGKLQPHPYWLPVILLSLQYGTADGVLAATVAILIGVVIGGQSQGVAEPYYNYVLRVWTVPMAWIVTAILIGEVRGRQRGRLAELTTQLTTSRDQAETITQHCFRLEQKIERLEREFATADHGSLDALVGSLRDLRWGGPEAWRDTLQRVHRGLLATGSLRVLLRSEDKLVPVADAPAVAPASAGPNAKPVAEAPPVSMALIDALMSSRRLLSANRPEDAAQLDGLAAMAAPLLGEQGILLGVVVLDGVTPERLSADTENRFELLARELGLALSTRGTDDLIAAGNAQAGIALPRLEAGDESGGRRIELFPRYGRA